jgi:ABC-type transport system involved in multi-copper enzyme maturation permease subunit
VSATLQQPPAAPLAPLPETPRGSLLKAELHRFRARRFIQVLVGLGVLGWAVAVVIGLLNFGTPTQADFADAQAQVDRILAENETFRQQCLEDPEAFGGPGAPEGLSPEEICGPELTADDIGGVESFLTKAPFDLGATGATGSVAFAGLAAALAFVIGATWIGAEWSSRSMVALLFWAPQRLKVMGTKLAVLLAGATVLGIAAQVGWLTMAGILDAAVGLDEPLPDDFWSQLLQTQARGVLLVVLAAVIGFGLTSIVRNTGAALGIGFVYVVVIQLVLGNMKPSWSQWMLGTNAVGLVNPGGLTLYFYDQVDFSTDNFGEPVAYYLGHLQSGLFLGGVAVLLVGVGSLLFARRDIH